MMPQPNYHDGGWDYPSRFVYRPEDGPLLSVDDYDDCPCGKEIKLKTSKRCVMCKLRERANG